MSDTLDPASTYRLPGSISLVSLALLLLILG